MYLLNRKWFQMFNLRRYSIELQISGKPIHAGSKIGLRIGFVLVTLVLYVVLGPLQHCLKLVDLRYFKVSGHDHSDHGFREVEEVGVVEDG